jgi:phosphatidylserine synthase
MLAAALAAAALQTAQPIAAIGAVSLAAFWHRHASRCPEAPPYGSYANYVTALRLLIILCAAALMVQLSDSWLLLLFAVNVALDVADGYLARRHDQVTRFGAAFDREADAVFVLVAYTYFLVMRDVGAWILLPGVLPYLYRLVAWRLREPAAPEERQQFAVRLAGANYVLLLLAVVVPAQPQLYVLIVSTSIVIASFLMSFWNLYRYAGSIP